MSNNAECSEYRQSVEKILSVSSTLKHGIEFDRYITLTQIVIGDGTSTKFVVSKDLYTDIAKMMYPTEYFRGMDEVETELFLSHMYNAVIKFKSMIFNTCKSNWTALYNDIPLKLELLIGDVFYFGRNEKEACLEHLNDTINVYGLDQILLTNPITFRADRMSDKLPYGTSVRWIASLPISIMFQGLVYNYMQSHMITVFDMFFGYQIFSRIQAALELELLQNYTPVSGDILMTQDKSYTLVVNPTQRCMYWAENQ